MFLIKKVFLCLFYKKSQGRQSDHVCTCCLEHLSFNIVLSKIKKLAIHGKILDFIKAFLTNRTQKVIVNATHSNPSPVISGVPQGSVLGPLIFLILIGDINDDTLHSTIRSFADDTRITKGVRNIKDTINLQSDLNTIYNWAANNNMQFNNDKFELIKFTQQNLPETIYLASNGTEIKEKTVIKDLGVLISNNATFEDHINKVSSAARHQASWVLRVFKSRSPELMLKLWKTTALPILEYCSQLWSPYKKSQISSIESIQWSFLRKIKGIQNKDYLQSLKSLNLYSLQRRRERYQIIYIWKILEGLVPDFGEKNQAAIKSYYSPRRGRLCILPSVLTTIPKSLQTKMYGSLNHIGPRLFNILPASERLLWRQSCSF